MAKRAKVEKAASRRFESSDSMRIGLCKRSLMVCVCVD